MNYVCRGFAAMALIKAKSADEVEEKVKEHDIAVVLFCASWYKACEKAFKEFQEASEAFSDVVFIYVDTDECKSVTERYGVKALPYTVVFFKGKPAFWTYGVRSSQQLASMIGFFVSRARGEGSGTQG